MTAPRKALLTLGILGVLAAAPAAEGSIKIAGNVTAATLRVNAHGVATVDYLKNGRWLSAVVRGRRVTYGRGALGLDVTVPTVAVAIPMAVALRVGPNGRFWALQAWQRIRGGQVELRLSRWRGAPTKLELWTHCCKWRSEIVRGRATFHGRPIYGFHSTPAGVPLDGLGRNVYIDSWRNGRWQRLMGILTHRPTGRFGLWIRRHWRGTQYQARMVGPNWGPMLGPDAFACCPQTRLR